MKKFYAVIFKLIIGVLFGFNVIGQVPYNNPNGNSQWLPLWSDDFNSFDNTKWEIANDFDHWGGVAACISQNVTISNGMLKLDVVKENYTCTTNVNEWGCKRQFLSNDPNFHYKYTVGYVSNKCDYNFKYGYMEAKIIFNNVKGTHGAFWTKDGCNRTNVNGSEIDIVEAYGKKQFNWLGATTPEYETALHLCYKSDNFDHLCVPWGTAVSHNVNSSLTGPHIFGVEWTPYFINFYLDGNLVREEFNNISVYDNLENKDTVLGVNDFIEIVFDNFIQEEYVTDQSLYNDFPHTPVSMYVDWVRVYKSALHYYDDMANYNEINPYFVNPIDDPNNSTKKKISIMWQLPSDVATTDYIVNWGETTSYGLSQTVKEMNTFKHLYKIDIGNLTPNQKYYYKINTLDNSIIYTGSFTTPPLNTNNSLNLTFFATGTKAIKNNSESYIQRENILTLINNDIVSNNTDQTFLILTNGFVSGDNKQFWNNEFFHPSQNWNSFRASHPIIGGVNGNERKGKLLNIWDDSFGDNFDNPVPGHNFRAYLPFNFLHPALSNNTFKHSHSLDYGPLHMCFHDVTDIDISDALVDDLGVSADLSGTSKEWKILSFYSPMKSLNGEVVNPNAYAKLKALANITGVQLILMGSEDYYAHWVDEGIHFVILGNGGATTNGIDLQKINDENLIMASTVPHYAKFRIEGDYMYVDVIQGADYNGYTAGRIIDKFAVQKYKNSEITNVQTWNAGDYPIYCDFLKINDGAHLTIESEVRFSPKDDYSASNLVNVRIYPGGKLTVTGDNAILDSWDGFTEIIGFADVNGNVSNQSYIKHKSFWGGINVKSTLNHNQLDASNHGVLELLNSATIKNALVAVNIFVETGANPNIQRWGGGILLADNANFVDNCTDIKMYPYENTYTLSNGTVIKIPNRTKILRSNFLTTDDYLDKNLPIKHIELIGVRSVYLAGNTFNNTNKLLAYHGTGIFSSVSSFNLTDIISSYPQTLKANTFNKLFYGVEAYNVTNKGKTTIKGSEFTNTIRSVYLTNYTSTEVLDNNILLPNFEDALIAPYGIYINGGTGFKVEENTITAEKMPVTHGIIVNGTGALNNELYNNTFNNLNVAIQPQDENKGTSINGANLGLRLFCNNYNGTYDAWVAKTPDYYGTVGIAADQQMSNLGNINDPYLPAANKFSTTFRMSYYDFDNTAGNGLYYYYDNTNPSYKAKPVYYNNIIPTPKYIVNTCPSKSNTGNMSISELYSNFTSAQIALNSSTTLLNIWKDGGNANLENEIKTIQPWDVYIEFNKLLSQSPFLSEDVLIATIDNPAFTPLMIKLLMIANPQASRSDRIMDMLYKRIPPLPQSYIDEIKDEKQTVSQFDLLVNDVSADYHLLQSIGEDIKRVYRTDTVNAWAADSLLAYVSRQPDLNNKYELATLYLERGEYEKMNSCLSSIPNNFKLTEQQYNDYLNFVLFFEIAQEVYSNESYEEFLTETQIQNLEIILNNKISQVSQLALALLVRNNQEFTYKELVMEPDESSARLIKPSNNASVNKNVLLKIYPNPTNNYVTIEYRTEEMTYTKLWVEIIDARGRKILVKELQGGNSEELINLNEISRGTYTVNLFADGNLLASEKLNVVK